MVTKLTDLPISVEPGEAFLLPRRAVQTLCAVVGPVWVTQEGRSDDIVLFSGGCVTLHGKAPVVVQGLLGRAELRLRFPETWRTRLCAWMGRGVRPLLSMADAASAIRKRVGVFSKHSKIGGYRPKEFAFTVMKHRIGGIWDCTTKSISGWILILTTE